MLRGLGEGEAAADAFLAVTERPAPIGEDEEALQQHAELVARALYERGAELVGIGRYDDAIAVFEDYTRRHPSGPQWGAAQQSIVFAVWRRVVGEAVTTHSSPRAFSKGVLTIDVLDPAWVSALEGMSAEILGKLNGALGKRVVRMIEWRGEA